MSFVIQGTPFVPDYKAKEKRLYQIIASRDDEIANLNIRIREYENKVEMRDDELNAVRAELRALKAKERRRATKRKKVADAA